MHTALNNQTLLILNVWLLYAILGTYSKIKARLITMSIIVDHLSDRKYPIHDVQSKYIF